MFDISGVRLAGSARKTALIAFGLSVCASMSDGQSVKAQQVPAAVGQSSGAATAAATVAQVPPVIDGRDDDSAWRSAQSHSRCSRARPRSPASG